MFQDLGYAASNELSPAAWEEYMLTNLNKQDQYQQQRLQQFVQMQERAKSAQKRQALVSGIKDALSYGMKTKMAQPGQSEFQQPNINISDQMETSVNPLKPFDVQNTKLPWEN